MRIEFTYARGPDHFAGYPQLSDANSSPLPGYLIAVVLALSGASLAVTALAYRVVQAAACGVFGLLLGVGIGVATRQRTRSGFVMPATAMESRQWVITEQGIEISHAGGSVTVAWPAFRLVMLLPRAYVFVMKDDADRRTIDIPREPLSEADDVAVREVLTHNGILFRPVVT